MRSETASSIGVNRMRGAASAPTRAEIVLAIASPRAALWARARPPAPARVASSSPCQWRSTTKVLVSTSARVRHGTTQPCFPTIQPEIESRKLMFGGRLYDSLTGPSHAS